jgi:alcohol dehydrogenase (quinone), cytochrome c subunit
MTQRSLTVRLLLPAMALTAACAGSPIDSQASTPSSGATTGETADALKAGKENGRGAQLYLDNCAACHRSNGQGSTQVFPALAGNPNVLMSNPYYVIWRVLSGTPLPSTKTASTGPAMPSFAWRLSDEEVAQLVSFVRRSWGNSAAGTTAKEVSKVRKTATPIAYPPS